MKLINEAKAVYIVSSCLAGDECRYNGTSSRVEKIALLVDEGKAIKVCPELLGGLSTPRACCEIKKLANGEKKVFNKDGEDVTDAFLDGAKKTLEIAVSNGIKHAILKSNSPSCGIERVYDGSFSGKLVLGNGFTAKLLSEHGICVESEARYLFDY